MKLRVLVVMLFALVLTGTACGSNEASDATSDTAAVTDDSTADDADDSDDSAVKTGACADGRANDLAFTQVAVVDASCDRAAEVMDEPALTDLPEEFTSGNLTCRVATSNGDNSKLYSCQGEGTDFVTFNAAR